MKNLEQPARPVVAFNQQGELRTTEVYNGLSKLEAACIELRLPATSDPELNDLIAQSQRRDLAAKAMEGIISSFGGLGKNSNIDIIASQSVKISDAMLAELSKSAKH